MTALWKEDLGDNQQNYGLTASYIHTLYFSIDIIYLPCACTLQSCLTLCDPMGCNLLGSSLSGILQARILGWVATFSSRGSCQPRD